MLTKGKKCHINLINLTKNVPRKTETSTRAQSLQNKLDEIRQRKYFEKMLGEDKEDAVDDEWQRCAKI